MKVFDSVTLPVELTPFGEGWTMVKGEDGWNHWRRPGPVLAALEGLMAWVCATAPLDGPGAAGAVLLVAAREAIDQAIADEIEEP